MAFFNTVAGALTLEIMAGHRSGITTTFAGRDHINGGNIVKNGQVQFLTNLKTLNGSCLCEVDEILPAPGQGILACQGREGENYFYLDLINDKNSKYCAIAERSFAKKLNAGCNVPVGAYAFIENEKIILKGLYIDEKTGKFYKGILSGNIKDAEIIGMNLAERIFS